MSTSLNDIELLNGPLTLPCGLTLPNRLVKVAMEPCLAVRGQPTPQHCKLHSEWARGGFGLLITENVQVTGQYLGTPHDIFIPPPHVHDIPRSWESWARSSSGSPTLVQLCHPGLQSCRGCGNRPFWESSIAPSSMRVSMGDSFLARVLTTLLFSQARSMRKEDIDVVVKQFQAGAILAHRSGFKGHGYLLAQFMSPRTNKRTDEYGGNITNRLRLLFEIVDAIRSSVPASFCLAIKLNSADFVVGGLSEDDALENVEHIVRHGGVDLIEISGGTYENTVFTDDANNDAHLSKSGTTKNRASGARREAFFADFAIRARARVQQICPIDTPLILLTGGFRTRRGMADAVASNHTDLIGIGRPACLNPYIASEILDPAIPEAVCPSAKIRGITLCNTLVPIKLIGAGFSTAWHAWQLQRLANGEKIDLNCSALGALRAILPSRSSCMTLLLWTIISLSLGFGFKRI